MNKGTNLVSIMIGNLNESLKVFGQKMQNGDLPIVARPTKGGFPFVSVPEGVYALKYKHGVLERKALKPGFHSISPFEEVKYVITKQITHFDVPIKECPTKDNVMVAIDVFLTFHIHDPILFIELLSPEKLNDMLRAAQEEAIRNLANKTLHTEIYDLIQIDETSILEELKLKFIDYGITITDLTITDVALPKDIAKRLEQETTFISRHRLQKRKQEFDLLITKHIEFLEQKRLKYRNERLAYAEYAKRERALISKEIDELEGRTDKHLAEIQVEADRIVKQIEKESDIYCSKLDEERISLLKKMRAEANRRKATLLAEAIAYSEELKAKTQAEVASLSAQATKILSEAEAEISAKLKAKREFSRLKTEIEVTSQLCTNNKDVIVSGNTNGNIIAQIAASNLQKKVFIDTFGNSLPK